jgi:hypothetical protein
MTDSRDASSIPPTAGPSADDAELALVMETYLTDVEAGRTPVIEEILAAHPRIADRLRACLSTIQFVEGAASPISAVPHQPVEPRVLPVLPHNRPARPRERLP